MHKHRQTVLPEYVHIAFGDTDMAHQEKDAAQLIPVLQGDFNMAGVFDGGNPFMLGETFEKMLPGHNVIHACTASLSRRS